MRLLDWLIDHPKVLGLLIASAAACAAMDAYELGIRIGRLEHSDAARLASEALGG